MNHNSDDQRSNFRTEIKPRPPQVTDFLSLLRKYGVISTASAPITEDSCDEHTDRSHTERWVARYNAAFAQAGN